ncbi:MAG TPA: thioredoxin-like domain-containing protein [Candidatus Nitrosotenuis sp.]|nr:thioredoxin-like domain-containing protein [Candidatus Nitrosotenuis sp.]
MFRATLVLLMIFASAEFSLAQAPASDNSPQQEKEKVAAPKPPDPEAALERAVKEAGNDQAALVRNLEDYLKRFPDAPRRAAVYRALIETSLQLRDNAKALEFAERLIAIAPDDSAMMLLAVDLLEKQGDDQSLAKASGYVTRVLDRVEKSPLGEKPMRVSKEDWEHEQKKLRMTLYLIRGRLEMQRKNYSGSVADLEISFRTLPNAPAAVKLGEIAELRKDYPRAIEHFLTAFVHRDGFSSDAEHREIRRKLGNVWRLAHGSEAGLAERLLAAYDRAAEASRGAEVPPRNANISDPFSMELRRVHGQPLPLAEHRGKILVLSFWATWCRPCRELQPLLEQAAVHFNGEKSVLFLAANRDEDETLVAPFLENHKTIWLPVFSDGLERIFRVESLPTVLVLDRAGKVVFRVNGYDPDGFLDGLKKSIRDALAASAAAN